jgi:hypothetical protein
LFTTDYLGKDITEYNLSASSSGWASGKSPVAGTDYVVELLGVRVETGVLVDKASNLQFITADTRNIKWK